MPTLYQAPSFDDKLKPFIENLHKSCHSDRKQEIQFIQKIHQHLTENKLISEEIAVALLIFTLENTASTPKKNYGTVFGYEFGYGSRLRQDLLTGLGITPVNQLDYCNKTIFLQILLDQIKQLPKSMELPIYQNPEELQKHINKTIHAIQKTSTAIADRAILQAKLPTQDSLIKNFASISASYEEQKKNSASKKDMEINFLRTLHEQCVIQNLDTTYLPLINQTQTTQGKSLGYLIRIAAVIDTMSEIENQIKYKYTPLSATRSELYKLCQLVSNIKHTRDVPAKEKYKYYTALHGLIRSQWENQQSPDARQFLFQLEARLLTAMSSNFLAKAPDPHPVLDNVRYGINYTAQTLIGIGVSTVSGGFVSLPENQRYVSRGCAWLGEAYADASKAGYFAKTAISSAGWQIGSAVEKRALSYSISYSIGNTFGAVIDTVSNAPGDLFYLVASKPLDLAYWLASRFSTPEPERNFENINYIKTLLLLSDDIIPKTEKKKYAMLFDLKLPEENTLVANVIAETQATIENSAEHKEEAANDTLACSENFGEIAAANLPVDLAEPELERRLGPV